MLPTVGRSQWVKTEETDVKAEAIILISELTRSRDRSPERVPSITMTKRRQSAHPLHRLC